MLLYAHRLVALGARRCRQASYRCSVLPRAQTQATPAIAQLASGEYAKLRRSAFFYRRDLAFPLLDRFRI
jgi:hypothetical protein